MAKALRQLGFSVYDGEEHFLIHYQQWWDIFNEGKEPDFFSMYQNVDAITDSPPVAFYEDIFKLFPEAKVVLMERDSEEVWVKSAINQLRELNSARSHPINHLLGIISPTSRNLSKLLDSVIGFNVGIQAGCKSSKFLFKKRYREHNMRVKQVIPAQQLLVYKVTQGWKPLCEFLECEEPLTPFPHENIKGEVAKNYGMKTFLESPHELCKRIRRELLTAFSVLVLLVFVIIYNIL